VNLGDISTIVQGEVFGESNVVNGAAILKEEPATKSPAIKVKRKKAFCEICNNLYYDLDAVSVQFYFKICIPVELLLMYVLVIYIEKDFTKRNHLCVIVHVRSE